MNPDRSRATELGFRMLQLDDGKSEFDRDLEHFKQYFGGDLPGNDGLTCLKCGAAVNLGWQHITWHEAMA
jgi:hypothetical protein